MIYGQRKQNCLATAIAVALRRLVPDESVFTPDAFQAEDRLEGYRATCVRVTTELLAKEFGLGDITFELDLKDNGTSRKEIIERRLKEGHPSLVVIDEGIPCQFHTIVVNDLWPDGSCEVVDPNIGSIRKKLDQVLERQEVAHSGYWYRRR